jgi:hypothetical protein
MLSVETRGIRRLKVKILLLFLAAATIVGAQRPTTQANAPNQVTTTTDNPPASLPTNNPFSAIRYWHRVKVLPNGKVKFLRHERYPALWARDAAGRVRIQSIDFHGDCDRPMDVVPPECDGWGEDVFDPSANIIIGWPAGPEAVDIAGIVPLASDQVSELLELTSGLRIPDPEPDDEATNTKTESLGEKDIDGVRATGVRTTAFYPPRHSGNKLPITIIHEVWTSTELGMAVRVIDGNPKGEESIRGLEKISLQPDPALFRNPDKDRLQRIAPQFTSVYVQHFKDLFAD